ncbi:MAG: hypothetical protein DRP89_00030 [Candidatus Neomarinimicrobiota bacterium]|nr:MAG: hypothetical protein DRP89_00030 [Candidatus Neomarinimicrobiota bacterium]
MPQVNHNIIFGRIKNQVGFNLNGAVITTYPLNPIDLKDNVNIFDTPYDQNFEVYEFSNCGILLFYLKNIPNTKFWREAVRTSIKLGIENFLFIGSGKPIGESFRFDGSIILDHVNLSGDNPLIGENDSSFGVRFPDMSNLYDSELIRRIRKASLSTGTHLTEGLLLVPLKVEQRTELEEKVIDNGNITAISKDVYAGAISAKHACCKSAGVVFFREDLDIDIFNFIRGIFA